MTKHYLLFLFLLPRILWANDPLVITESDFGSLRLDPHMIYYEDPSNMVSINDILSGRYDAEFSDSVDQIKNKLLTSSTFWLKTTIVNKTLEFQEFFIHLEDPSHYKATMFYRDQSGKLMEQVSGIGVPPSEKELKGHIIYFKVQIPAGQESTIYFKTITKNFIVLPFSLHSVKSFNNQFFFERFVLGLFYGLLVAIVLYNLFYYYSTKNYTSSITYFIPSFLDC